jgi:iron complex transport system ATP-binding protein
VTVLAAIHDLNMAALYCDRLYVLKEGRVVLQGTPEEVLTPAHLEEVYGVRSTVETHPITGKRVITFLPAALSGGDMTFDPGTLNSKEVSS